FSYLFYNRIEFLTFGLVNQIFLIITGNWTVGWNFHNIHFIDLPEFPGLCNRRTRHTRKFTVHTEVVLKGYSCKGLGSIFDLHIFLGLDRLVQSVAVASSFHDTAGLLINDL